MILSHMLTSIKYLRDRIHPLHLLRKSRLFRWVVTPLDFPIWVHLYGISHPVSIRSVRHASYLFNLRTIEPEILALFVAIQSVYAPKTFWDVGGYIGYYTWLLKTLDQHITVYLFEPDAKNRNAIAKTLTKSGLPDVTILPIALSDSEGDKTFATDYLTGATGTLEESAQSFLRHHYQLDPTLTTVPTSTIDRLRVSTASIDFLKIDVEGHETKVFAGAKETLQQDQPIIIFESFTQTAPILAQLRESNYLIYDAERMSDQLDQATNYLAMPPRCLNTTDLLFETWRKKNAALWKS